MITETSTYRRHQVDIEMKEPSFRRARMTQGRQSRKESTLPKLLSSKTITRVGTWNVRTMYEGRKATVIAREMKNYGDEVLRVR